MTTPNRWRVAIVALIVSCLAAACREEVGEVVRLNPTVFSAADEAAIGTALFDADWRAADVPVLVPGSPGYHEKAGAYLTPLLDQLVMQSAVTRRDSFAWAIHLVLGADEHAYTLPGGQIVMHTGLLHAIDNEAEYVGLLAREVALAEQGAAMAAYDRAVEDNVLLGDLLLGNGQTDTDLLIRLAGTIQYTPEELAAADSLAAELICPSNYLHEGLPVAVAHLPEATAYRSARPSAIGWDATFGARVANCIGTDSTYTNRYRELLRRAVPR